MVGYQSFLKELAQLIKHSLNQLLLLLDLAFRSQNKGQYRQKRLINFAMLKQYLLKTRIFLGFFIFHNGKKLSKMLHMNAHLLLLQQSLIEKDGLSNFEIILLTFLIEQLKTQLQQLKVKAPKQCLRQPTRPLNFSYDPTIRLQVIIQRLGNLFGKRKQFKPLSIHQLRIVLVLQQMLHYFLVIHSLLRSLTHLNYQQCTASYKQLYPSKNSKFIYMTLIKSIIIKMEPESESEAPDQQNLLRSLRFIEQICFLLRLSRPCTKTAMDYFHLLLSSQTHQYPIEIMIAASIFISAKIFESERKIRDILNMVFVDTALHRTIRHQQQASQQQSLNFHLEQVFQNKNLKNELQPSYSFNDYNQLKSKTLEAEQHLLRILRFDFAQPHKNQNQIKTILVLIHQLRLPQITAQAIINTYNDLPFTGAEKWIAGVFYFGYLLGNALTKIETEDEYINTSIANEEWEIIFCTKIQKLRNYANKITNFYHTQHQERTAELLQEQNGSPKSQNNQPQKPQENDKNDPKEE